MDNRQPLKQILIATLAHWDRPQVRAAVRENFGKIIYCRTCPWEPKSLGQKPRRSSFTTHANRGRAQVVGSGLLSSVNGSSGALFPTSPIPASA